MNQSEEARARLAEITERRKQVLDGSTRGRHRGWDATGGLAMIAGFAALDLPAPTAVKLVLFGAATVLALVSFTRAGQYAQVVLDSSRLGGRFWVLMTGSGLVFGVLTYFGLRALDLLDFPLPNTLFGVVLTAVVVATHPLYRTLLRMTA
jgi:hypothetical protein